MTEAHDLMRANRIRHLPVIADCKLVEDAMTRDVFVVDAATPLAKGRTRSRNR